MFESLDKKGTRFLRGQYVLVCAAPGVGKSALILTYALKAKVPTFYFSADSDSFTQLSRATSILTGWPLEKSAAMVRAEDLNGATPLIEKVPIWFEYDAAPTLDVIETKLKGYFAVFEDYPSLVVVDNITNVDSGTGEDPFEGLEALNDYLHTMARNTGACVVGLHHVLGEYNDGLKPIPLSGVKGQVGRVPEMILTLHKAAHYDREFLRVSTVKNRSSKADPSGQDWVQLEFSGDNMQIKDTA